MAVLPHFRDTLISHLSSHAATWIWSRVALWADGIAGIDRLRKVIQLLSFPDYKYMSATFKRSLKSALQMKTSGYTARLRIYAKCSAD